MEDMKDEDVLQEYEAHLDTNWTFMEIFFLIPYKLVVVLLSLTRKLSWPQIVETSPGDSPPSLSIYTVSNYVILHAYIGII